MFYVKHFEFQIKLQEAVPQKIRTFDRNTIHCIQYKIRIRKNKVQVELENQV